MIIGITGHRPHPHLGGYNIPNPTYNSIVQQIEEMLIELRPEKVITGMALGCDLWTAEICIKLNIPFIAAVPFRGQESAWPDFSQIHYRKLLNESSKIIYVSDGSYDPKKMQIRNEWIVDNCDLLIGVWNGKPSGTGNCINYAKEKNKEIKIISI